MNINISALCTMNINIFTVTKLEMLVLYDNGSPYIKPCDLFIPWTYVITWKIKNNTSTSKRPRATKLDRTIINDKKLLHKTWQDPVIAWSREVLWQINKYIFPSMTTTTTKIDWMVAFENGVMGHFDWQGSGFWQEDTTQKVTKSFDVVVT